MAKFAGAVTAAQGFQAAGVHAGIKTSNHTKKDVAMIYSTVPCVVAGVFTTNVGQGGAGSLRYGNCKKRRCQSHRDQFRQCQCMHRPTRHG